jgi:hypothetical protein
MATPAPVVACAVALLNEAASTPGAPPAGPRSAEWSEG